VARAGHRWPRRARRGGKIVKLRNFGWLCRAPSLQSFLLVDSGVRNRPGASSRRSGERGKAATSTRAFGASGIAPTHFFRFGGGSYDSHSRHRVAAFPWSSWKTGPCPSAWSAWPTARPLETFDSASPGTIQTTVAVSGLAANESVQGIDYRPATGQLYGLVFNQHCAHRPGGHHQPLDGRADLVGRQLRLHLWVVRVRLRLQTRPTTGWRIVSNGGGQLLDRPEHRGR